MQIRMNANIQREWQINLGQGRALMQVRSGAVPAEGAKQHRHTERCAGEVHQSLFGQCSMFIFLSVSQNDQAFNSID